MMTKHPIFDDIAKVAGGASGVVSGIKEEIESLLQSHLQDKIQSMDLVSREEFEVQKTMLLQAKKQIESLQEQVESLKKSL